MSVCWYRWDADDLLLRIKAQAGSSRDGFVGLYGDRLRVRIAAPAVEGKANVHLTTWLASQFGVRKADVVIETGTSSPLKTVRIRTPSILPDTIDVSRKT